MADPRFLVYSRESCTLCEEFVEALARELGACGEPFAVREVDADPEARRRYGLKVPVLTCHGSVVCHGVLDAAAVARLLGRGAGTRLL